MIEIPLDLSSEFTHLHLLSPLSQLPTFPSHFTLSLFFALPIFPPSDCSSILPLPPSGHAKRVKRPHSEVNYQKGIDVDSVSERSSNNYQH